MIVAGRSPEVNFVRHRACWTRSAGKFLSARGSASRQPPDSSHWNASACREHNCDGEVLRRLLPQRRFRRQTKFQGRPRCADCRAGDTSVGGPDFCCRRNLRAVISRRRTSPSPIVSRAGGRRSWLAIRRPAVKSRARATEFARRACPNSSCLTSSLPGDRAATIIGFQQLDPQKTGATRRAV